MRRLFKFVALALCISCVAGCGVASTPTDTREVVVNETDTADEAENEEVKDAEETEALEEAKEAEEEKAANEAEEAKTAEEEKAKEDEKTVEEEADVTEEAVEEVPDDGLDEKVDRTQIVKYDTAKKMYLQSAANVRKGPSTKFDRVDYFKLNQEVSVVGRYGEKGWYLIEYKDGNAFISNSLLGENEVDLEALKAQKEAEALAAIQAAQAAEAQAAQAAQAAAAQQAQNEQNQAAQVQLAPAPQVAPVMAPAGILFIGDSRCVQMQEATNGGGCSWVCEGGKGYGWFTTKAMERAEPSIGKGTKVVICLGVNDPGNANAYAAFVNQKAAEWAARGAKTYYVSVNPVWDNPWTSPEQVINFNGTVASQLAGVRWIDTYSVLMSSGFGMVDGMHFDYNTNVTVFNLIVGSLR